MENQTDRFAFKLIGDTDFAFFELRRQGKNIYYYHTQGGYEIDFVTVDQNGERELIQVTWDMSDPKTLERETRAIEQAEKELGIRGRIITSRDYAVEGCHQSCVFDEPIKPVDQG